MISFFRIIKFAFQDIYRNLSLSFMTILILVLMLLSINTLVVINVFTDKATDLVKSQIDISVYFQKDAPSEKIDEIKEYVSNFSEVETAKLKTPEENLQEFKQEYKGNEKILSSIEELEQNPLGATLIIKTTDPGDYNKIIEALSVPEYKDVIESKTFSNTQKAINRIQEITSQVERFSLALSVLFAVIAFVIIFNTIRVAIYTQRTEISIKKLVGATNWFVRGPYLFQGLFFSVVSVAITAGLVFLAVKFIDPYIATIFQEQAMLTNYFRSNIMLLFGAQLAAVLVLTWISSLFAMRRHLRA
ncbi:MAG: cell division protein FtsX [Candidatus Paceibacteria bacterium]